MTPQEIQQLTGQMIAFLTPAAPYLATGGVKVMEGALKKGGEELYDKARELVISIRDRFKGNDDAEQTLDLFLKKPETFGTALAEFLATSLEKHPDWAAQVQALLSQPSAQEVIARHSDIQGRIVQELEGRGTQKIDLDDVQLGEKGSIKQTKR